MTTSIYSVSASVSSLQVNSTDIIFLNGSGVVTIPGSLIVTGSITNSGLIGGAPVIVSATTQTAVAGNHYVLTNVAATTVTLPASPAAGNTVAITPDNSLLTNIVARNGQTIMGLAEDMTLDSSVATVTLRFLNSTWRLV